MINSYIEAYTSNRPPSILAFGDSVFLRTASDDGNFISLGKMLENFYKKNIYLVAGSGYHIGLFECYVEVLKKLPHRPKLVILPINLRSFSPTWDLNPLYQFHYEIETLSSLISDQTYRNSDSSNIYGIGENSQIILEYSSLNKISLGDFLKIISEKIEINGPGWTERMNKIFNYHYMYKLRSGHRKLNSLKKSIRILNDMDITVYSYFTPINYEAGVEYCGKDFFESIEKNIFLIQREICAYPYCKSIKDLSALFALDDFSFSLTRKSFFTPHNGTEHLRYDGRQFIFQHLSNYIAQKFIINSDN